MISGKVYRTVRRQLERAARHRGHGAMRINAPGDLADAELLSYWLPLDDAKVMCRYLNDESPAWLAKRRDGFIGLGAFRCRTPTLRSASLNMQAVEVLGRRDREAM